MKSRFFLCHVICYPSQLVLEFTCLGGQFGKLPKCIFKNVEIAQVKRGQFQKFRKFIPKIAQTKLVITG